ncbi:hypothetical protein QTP86_028178 [Hemibagrus guttatus]|nr:hypothetical protein QTP86_028178 [Hemibagrus guttatus]
MARRPSNLKELELIAKDEWAKIPVETCKKLLFEAEDIAITMLCWGNASYGQLGLGGIDEEIIVEPRKCDFFDGKVVRDVGCGRRHTVFLPEDGTVYTCGCNDLGQLGHDKARKKPEQVMALDAQNIVAVSCGEAHTLALSDKGQVFAWGQASDGQLGLANMEECMRVPRTIKSLSDVHVVQVSCGYRHSLALSRRGHVYSWGQNRYGQLGLGKEGPCVLTPQVIQALQGIPFAQISAGGAHSFALTMSGAVFGWGRNKFGQLGLNDNNDRCFPTLLKTLRSQGVVYICCGENHTAALTKEGGVFTFGAGGYGQLGHNSINHEINPRKVFELMGNVVTQVACGSFEIWAYSVWQHTLAFIPSSGKIDSFGLGGNGQLGTRHTCNRISPAPVKGQWRAHNDPTPTESGRRGSSLSRDAQTSLSPDTSSNSSGGTPRRSPEAFPGQLRDIVSPACPGSSPEPLPGGACPEHLPREMSRRHPKQMPEPPQLPPFDVEEQRLYSKLLPGDRAPYPISKGAPHHPTEEAHFGRLYPGSYPFGHDPELMTIGFGTWGPLPMTATQNTLHRTLMLLPVGGGPMGSEIDDVFSSASCLNGSFLSTSHPDHYRTSSKCPGVDMNMARLLFNKLIQPDLPHISQQIADSLGRHLIPNLCSCPPDIEALRLYLILPECPLFKNPNNYITLTIPFAKAVIDLSSAPLKVLVPKSRGQIACFVAGSFECLQIGQSPDHRLHSFI